MASAQTQVKEPPLIFTGESVRAILEGRKTQTRRVIKPQPPKDGNWFPKQHSAKPELWYGTAADRRMRNDVGPNDHHCEWKCPYGSVGDRLWVKETWAAIHPRPDWGGVIDEWEEMDHIQAKPSNYWRKIYSADKGFWSECKTAEERGFRWRSSTSMPRWASRLTLEITDIRVERLQDVTETDAISEGCCNACHPDFHTGQFHDTWDRLNAKRGFGWEVNPWVWVIEFYMLGKYNKPGGG